MNAFLSSPQLLDMLEHANDDVRVISALNSAPLTAFEPSDENVLGLMQALGRARGDNQAHVLMAALSRGQPLLGMLDVSRHLFVAQKVGCYGSAEGARKLREVWNVANLSLPDQQGLMDWVGRHALMSRHSGVWEEVKAWPSQAARPDRLTLAFKGARSSEDFDWGWQFKSDACWKTCLGVVKDVLDRAWPARPMAFAISNPGLAVSVSQTLMEGLPWDNPAVPSAVAEVLNAPLSPFTTLVEHEYRMDPHVRLEALEACLPWVRSLEQRRVTLACGSRLLERARDQQHARLNARH